VGYTAVGGPIFGLWDTEGRSTVTDYAVAVKKDRFRERVWWGLFSGAISGDQTLSDEGGGKGAANRRNALKGKERKPLGHRG